MRIAISGVTGFLGSNLAAGLLLSGFEVVGIKRASSNLSRLKEVINHKNFSLVDVDRVSSIFESPVDAVIHTATSYGRDGEPLDAIDGANINLPLVLWQHCQKGGAAAFLNTDTFMSKETPKDDRYYNYVATKKEFLEKAKATLLKGNTKFINMVVSHMYGPNDNPEKFLAVIIKQMLANEPEIQLTSGEQKRDFIYISDVIAAFNQGLNNLDGFSNFEEFNIGTGRANSIREAVECLHKILDSKSHLVWGALPSRQHDSVYGAADISCNSKLRWQAQISLGEGLKMTAEYYISHKA